MTSSRHDGVTAHPLCWPDGWKRTPFHLRQRGDRFVTRSYESGQSWPTSRAITFDRARRLLVEELARLKATGVIISSNIPLRNDGLPRAELNQAMDDAREEFARR